MTDAKQPLYLRCEMKKAEHRAALTPTTAKALLDAGFDVTVERDPQRIFDDEEYERVGCKLSPHNTWTEIPSHIPIIGLKELPSPGPPLPHTHIQFAHCYKEQGGWVDVLSRFKQGGGKLYDLEFLEDSNGRRVAAFGWHAGFSGAALGLLSVAEQQKGSRLGPQKHYPNEEALMTHVRVQVDQIKSRNKDGKVKALVIGALGRCGRGAVDCLQKAGVADQDIVKWDIQETSAKPGPYDELLDVDVFVNCIYLNKRIPPFLNRESLSAKGDQRRLACIVDVSCDTTNPNNPLPVYDINTTFDEPTVDVDGLDKAAKDALPLTVISIDHLPTLLPREASEAFSTDLLPSLLQLPYVTGHKKPEGKDAEKEGAVWDRAEKLFRTKMAEAEKAGA